MPVIDVEQGSVDWLQMRIGIPTASRVADVQSFLKRASKNGGVGEESAARRNYKYAIAIECLTGRAQSTYVSPEMEWGTATEPLARADYEMANDVEVVPGGFALHDRISRFGASSDGLVGNDGMTQFKCPTTQTHIEYLLAGIVPFEYRPQMLAEMACYGRQWSDFVSFDPRLPKRLQRFQKRFMRDDGAIAEMEQAVVKFLAEVDELLERLKQDDPSSLEGVLQKSVAQVS